ncbi:hypothetical protein ES705_19417 [subsurface metagenome]
MTWTTQYFHEFRDTNDFLCRVDIMKDAAALDTELEGEPSPFKIIYPGIKDKLDPVRGSGVELNLYSATDRQLLNLFTADIQEYRIKYWVDDIWNNHNLTWFGYLDSEQYSEDYSSLTDYPVQFTGNNGLGLLDKIKFYDTGDIPYTGLKTQWDVLEIILTKWGLLDLVTKIKVYLSTTSDYITPIAEETIFHDTYVSCANYYDEDGEPMSCREVLEAILRPYGAFLTMIGTEILITDLHTLATDAGYTWKVYDNTLTYDTTEASETIGDIETIGYYKGGAKLDMQSGRNTQVVKYSPYAPDELDSRIQWNGLPEGEGSNMTFETGSEPTFVEVDYGWDSTFWSTDGIDPESHDITAIDGWTFIGAGSPAFKVAGMKEDEDGSPEFIIRKDCLNYWIDDPDESYFDDDHSEVTFDLPYVIGNTGYYIKITGQILPLTRLDKYHQGSFPARGDFNHVALLARLRIGDFLYSAGTYSWIPYPETITTDHQFRIFGGSEDGNCVNQWNSFKTIHWAFTNSVKHPVTEDAIYIYVDEGIHGKVSLEITMMEYAYIGATANDYQTKCMREIWLKDIKIEIVQNPSFEPISGDIEYTGEIIKSWKEEGKKVTLYHGNSTVGSPFDNAGLIYDSGAGVYKFIPDWSRGSLTDVTIEKLLLNTIQSNYETKTTKLSVNINNSSHLPFLRVEDDSYLSGQMLMFAGGTIDCAHNSLECSLMEIKPDTLTL